MHQNCELCILMKKIFPILFFLCFLSFRSFAQSIDSISMNLYTDSLKKGQHNYINVDGKYSNGKWLPLGSKEIEFSCSSARFEGNELILPENFREKKVVVKAVLRSNPTLWVERVIWVKQLPDPMLPRRN
jgi:hypothetical protein